MSMFSSFPRAQTECYNDLDMCSFPNSHATWKTCHQPTIETTPPAYFEFDQHQQQQPTTHEYRASQFGSMHQVYYHGEAPGAFPVNNSQMLSNPKDYSGPFNSSKKKAFHNARERRRRKTLKVLYSQLRSLLPNLNPKRKLSIPNTVCRVLKYIPELRNEIEKHRRERDELLATSKRSTSESLERSLASKFASTTRAEGLIDFTHSTPPSASLADHPNVTVNASLGNSQLIITIYNCRIGFLFSTLLVLLEKKGLDVLDAASFSSQDKVCHILHLEIIAGRSAVDTTLLQKKLLRLLSNE